MRRACSQHVLIETERLIRVLDRLLLSSEKVAVNEVLKIPTLEHGIGRVAYGETGGNSLHCTVDGRTKEQCEASLDSTAK